MSDAERPPSGADANSTAGEDSARLGPLGRFRRTLVAARWPVFVLPLAVYMLANAFEPPAPKPPETVAAEDEAVENETPEAEDTAAEETEPAAGLAGRLGIEYRHYPLVYSAKLLLTLAVVAFVWPGIRDFPRRVTPLAVGVGLAGAVLWIALCEFGLEGRILEGIGLGHLVDATARSAYNPLEQMAGNPAQAYAFLAVRFAGLVLVVPLIEELLWRGFLMRFLAGSPWWEIPFGEFDGSAVAITTVMFVAAHPPTEAFAAATWFLAVTGLMLYGRNLWDCIVAHAVTNLALGIYVVATGSWWLM